MEKIFLLLFVVLGTPNCFAGPLIEDLPAGQWYEVPQSKLSDSGAIPNPAPPGVTGIRSIMSAWNGGVYDSRRDRLLVTGGGHWDYSGTEVYAFSLVNMTWERITDPYGYNEQPRYKSEEEGRTAIKTGKTDSPLYRRLYYDDGTPVSRHVYGSIDYDANTDSLYIFGGRAIWATKGDPDPESVYRLDLDFTKNTNKKWKRIANQDIPADYGVIAVFDPNSGHFFIKGGGGGRDTCKTSIKIGSSCYFITEYDPVNQTSTRRYEERFGSIYLSGTIDTKRHLFIIAGTMFAKPLLVFWDLSQNGLLQRKVVKNTGDTSWIRGAPNPGLQYDPVTDSIVLWRGGTNIYQGKFNLDLSEIKWTKLTSLNIDKIQENTNGLKPKNGVYGRFRYSPKYNAFIVVNSIYENVFIYKLSPETTAQSED